MGVKVALYLYKSRGQREKHFSGDKAYDVVLWFLKEGLR
jgi:hypothetical protein